MAGSYLEYAGMRIFYSPFHSFVHKTLVVAHEAGLWERLTRVPSFPFRDLNGQFVTGQYDLSKLAPLGKVPCLALEDGTVLYGSQTIVEFLDAQRETNRLYPSDGPKRWDALRRLALGDTLFECAVQLSMGKRGCRKKNAAGHCTNGYGPRLRRHWMKPNAGRQPTHASTSVQSVCCRV